MRGELLDFHPGADMTWEIVDTDTSFKTVERVGANAGGPPVHVHPSAEQRLEVLEGTLDVFVDGHWRKLGPGEKAVVPPGVAHTLKNDSDRPATILDVHAPPMEFEAFFRQLHRLLTTGKAKLPPTDPRSLIYLAMLFSSRPGLIRMVKPPQAVFSALAFVGRRLGYRIDG